jgi:hypothetical protein
MRSAVFWRDYLGAFEACDGKYPAGKAGIGECMRTKVESKCPELVGTPWGAAFPILRK